MLNGYWPNKPAKIVQGNGFGIHFVERSKCIYIGEYSGVKEESNGQYSLVLDDVHCFEVTDLHEIGETQAQLKTILKQPGAVIYSYFTPSATVETLDGPTYKMGSVKQRLQQKAFRNAVFDFHGARCTITGCVVEELLEAAHLSGKSWETGHNTSQDGIPLRADLHRAYDAGLIELDSDYHLIAVHENLREEYARYIRP